MERARITAAFAGAELGILELPVCDGTVQADVLADAAADLFSWEILRLFFERELYPALRADPARWLEQRSLGDMVSAAELASLDASELHDRVGWGAFLQELWGSTEEPAALYAAPAGDVPVLLRLRRMLRRRGWHRVEIGGQLEPIRGPCDIAVVVGGSPLGIVPADRPGELSPRTLRGMITATAGYELCRAAVREALIGHLDEGEGNLRQRLQEAGQAEPQAPPPTAGDGRQLSLKASGDVEPVPGWRTAATRLRPYADVLVAPREAGRGAIGTSASRRAAIPSGAGADLLAAAETLGEPVVFVGEAPDHPRVRYTPELIWRSARSPLGPGGIRGLRARVQRRSPATPAPGATDAQRRHRFESAFAGREDPWRYENEYEQTKYRLTLSLVPERPGRALEVGCAEGHFTELLAPRVGRLLAADISAIAVERAERRCAAQGNVEFTRLDLVSDPLPGEFDLVVCSETLYFTGDRAGLDSAARRLASAVAPGGHLLTANAHQVIDDSGSPGFDWGLPFGAKTIGEALAATGPLSLAREIRTPLYRVQLFRRPDGSAGDSVPAVTEIEQPAPVPEHVASTVRWSGGTPASEVRADGPATDRLPILVYHRVASKGAESRFRITPEAFEEQLAYMRSAGFRSVGLDEWGAAMDARRPLPGRAVMLTFDDGYRNFAEYAWPLLRRYGFGAVLFVIADEVGGWNRWSERGERIELLGWDELVRLRDEGVDVGSHSATHRRMTELSPVEIARQAARSRAELARRLGEPPPAFAYPYGATDGVVQHLVGACGYRYGLAVSGVRCRLQDRPLAMPRVEVASEDGLPAFIVKLNA